MIVTGRAPPNVANLQLNFGDYVQLQMDNNPTNTMRPRHIDCIALHPTGTTQGSYYFMDLHSSKRQHGRQWTQCMMTEDIIYQVEALGRTEKQSTMHDGPIATWTNGNPIAPAVISDDDADAGMGDAVAPDPPLFLPLPTIPLDLDDIDVAMVAPLQVVMVNVGAENVQGAPVQGVLVPPAEDEEMYYERGANGTAEGEVKGSPRYNLRRQQQPTFVSYNNPNRIEDLDLDLSSFDFSISIDDDATEEVYDSFDINLTQIPVSESSRERTFGNGDKPRDIDEVRNMSYQFMVTQMMKHEEIAKHGEKAVEALMKEDAQLDKLNVFKPLDAASLTVEKKARSL